MVVSSYKDRNLEFGERGGSSNGISGAVFIIVDQLQIYKQEPNLCAINFCRFIRETERSDVVHLF